MADCVLLHWQFFACLASNFHALLCSCYTAFLFTVVASSSAKGAVLHSVAQREKPLCISFLRCAFCPPRTGGAAVPFSEVTFFQSSIVTDNVHFWFIAHETDKYCIQMWYETKPTLKFRLWAKFKWVISQQSAQNKPFIPAFAIDAALYFFLLENNHCTHRLEHLLPDNKVPGFHVQQCVVFLVIVSGHNSSSLQDKRIRCEKMVNLLSQ